VKDDAINGKTRQSVAAEHLHAQKQQAGSEKKVYTAGLLNF
jgi:hypothetical protein